MKVIFHLSVGTQAIRFSMLERLLEAKKRLLVQLPMKWQEEYLTTPICSIKPMSKIPEIHPGIKWYTTDYREDGSDAEAATNEVTNGCFNGDLIKCIDTKTTYYWVSPRRGSMFDYKLIQKQEVDTSKVIAGYTPCETGDFGNFAYEWCTLGEYSKHYEGRFGPVSEDTKSPCPYIYGYDWRWNIDQAKRTGWDEGKTFKHWWSCPEGSTKKSCGWIHCLCVRKPGQNNDPAKGPKFLGEPCRKRDQCDNEFTKGHVDLTCAPTVRGLPGGLPGVGQPVCQFTEDARFTAWNQGKWPCDTTANRKEGYHHDIALQPGVGGDQKCLGPGGWEAPRE